MPEQDRTRWDVGVLVGPGAATGAHGRDGGDQGQVPEIRSMAAATPAPRPLGIGHKLSGAARREVLKKVCSATCAFARSDGRSAGAPDDVLRRCSCAGRAWCGAGPSGRTFARLTSRAVERQCLGMGLEDRPALRRVFARIGTWRDRCNPGASPRSPAARSASRVGRCHGRIGGIDLVGVARDDDIDIGKGCDPAGDVFRADFRVWRSHAILRRAADGHQGRNAPGPRRYRRPRP
jgi:hypothetical protein